MVWNAGNLQECSLLRAGSPGHTPVGGWQVPWKELLTTWLQVQEHVRHRNCYVHHPQNVQYSQSSRRSPEPHPSSTPACIGTNLPHCKCVPGIPSARTGPGNSTQTTVWPPRRHVVTPGHPSHTASLQINDFPVGSSSAGRA